MGNETRHYFGAYLKIAVDKVQNQSTVTQCKNGHRAKGKFCQVCGNPIFEVDVITQIYPTSFYDLFDNDLDDVLSVITPQTLYGTGTIIAIANDSDAGKWLYLPRWNSGDVPVMVFPTNEEVDKLKSDFHTQYLGLIHRLQDVPAVLAVTVEAGYVLNEEY